MTARSTWASAPDVVCGMPISRAPTTAAPIAHTSRPRASADRRAERARATDRWLSERVRERFAWSRVPARDSSVAPSNTASVVAAMSVRACAPCDSASRTDRAMSAGATIPETMRAQARIAPAAGEMMVTTPTVPTPTMAATREGSRVLTTTFPTSSTSEPARVMRSPRRSVVSVAVGASDNRS